MSPQELTKEAQVWERYRAIPRVLTPEYVRTIPWEKLGPCPSENFARALMIASDVETATYDVFFLQELSFTASQRDPIIRQFMDRWVAEELTHGELLRKVLHCWGYPYQYQTPRFGVGTRTAIAVTRFWGKWFGKQFKALHMIWGGINELTARETYRRLRESTADPVLRQILGAIIKEESLHANFYLGMADAKIDSWLVRSLGRFSFLRWRPVGAWNKTHEEYKPVLALFHGRHLQSFDRNVTKEFERRLPVFAGSGLTEILQKMIRAANLDAGRSPAVADR